MVLIVGNKYGTIDSDTQKSYTEKEFDYACEKKIPILAFVSDCNVCGTDKKSKKLIDFRKKIDNNRLVCRFKDAADFEGAVASAISKEKHTFVNPWYRISRDERPISDGGSSDRLSSLAIRNYWNDEAVVIYEKHKAMLDSLPQNQKWEEPLDWTGGQDFTALFEVRDDSNMILTEKRQQGVIKSIRYVYFDAKVGKMMVDGWWIKQQD